MGQIDETLKRAHPEQPWRWRKDWEQGRIHAGDGEVVALAWLFAVVFGGFSVPLLLKVPGLLEDGPIGAFALALLLPLGACGMCYWAIRSTLRWRRFRGIVLVLDRNPGVIGGSLRGTVHVPARLGGEGSFRLRLSCVRRQVRKSGGKRKVSESVVWQDEHEQPLASVLAGPTGAALRVDFQIPFESEPTSPENGDDIHSWRLDVMAELSGPDLASVFEVPVFRTGQSSPDVTDSLPMDEPDREQGFAPRSLDDESLPDLDDPNVRARLDPEGMLELFFPAGRNRAAAGFLLLFSCIWNGFIAFGAQQMSFPFALFLTPFVLVGVLLVGLTVLVAFHSLVVRAHGDRIDLVHRLLGIQTGTQTIQRDEIESITPQVRGHTNGRALWGIRLARKNGRPRWAGGSLSKPDAERLATVLHRILHADS